MEPIEPSALCSLGLAAGYCIDPSFIDFGDIAGVVETEPEYPDNNSGKNDIKLRQNVKQKRWRGISFASCAKPW